DTVDVPRVTDSTVTIGTHTPLTGSAAAGYSSISAAASAYFAYLNENGGVHGRTIEYSVQDDGYNPANTQAVRRQLVQPDAGFAGRTIEYIVKAGGYNPANTQPVVPELVQQDSVFAILSALGTPTHTAVLDYLNQNKVPDLFVASGSTSWNQPQEFPYTFG